MGLGRADVKQAIGKDRINRLFRLIGHPPRQDGSGRTLRGGGIRSPLANFFGQAICRSRHPLGLRLSGGPAQQAVIAETAISAAKVDDGLHLLGRKGRSRGDKAARWPRFTASSRAWSANLKSFRTPRPSHINQPWTWPPRKRPCLACPRPSLEHKGPNDPWRVAQGQPCRLDQADETCSGLDSASILHVPEGRLGLTSTRAVPATPHQPQAKDIAL